MDDNVCNVEKAKPNDEDNRVKGVLAGAIAACSEAEITHKTAQDSKFSPPVYEKVEFKNSFLEYLHAELRRGYSPANDEAHYSERREKIYLFMTIPKDVEKFMLYGSLQCIDVLLYIFTYLPLRFLLAMWFLFYRGLKRFIFRYNGLLLQPAETCDILKGIILMTGFMVSIYFDTSVLYHVVKSQSVIKLYLIFNMLEVADRLFSSFGQDTLDVLYYTASETKTKKREYAAMMPHLLLAVIYVSCHIIIVLFQATTLNVAINSQNKALLTIMMSNNFVELKGSVFKKFEKNNLFQMSCSDVRERIHYLVLLLFVIVQTMKAYAWRKERLFILFPDCFMVLMCEVLVDWVKHGFITRFNEIPSDVYREYSVSLAYDLATSKQKNAFSHHSDLVSRKMGFTPFPLAIILFKVFHQAISLDSALAKINFALALVCLFLLKVACSIFIFGRACDFIEEHQKQKNDKNETDAVTDTRCKSHPVSRKNSQDSLLNQSKAKSVPQTPSLSNSASMTDISNPTNSLDQGAIFTNSTVSLNSICLNDAVLEREPPPKFLETDQKVQNSCMARGRANSTSGIRHRVSLVERPSFYFSDENNINNNVT